MRSLIFFLDMAVLLPLAVKRPFVGVLLWCWISYMVPQQIIYGFATSLPWAQLIFAATVIGCIVNKVPKRFPANPMTLLILAFLVAITLTTSVALAPLNLVLDKWQLVFKSFLFLLIAAGLLTDRRRIHALVWVLALSLCFYAIKGGAFTLMHGGSGRVMGPPSSMITDNNHLAAAELVMLPLLNYLRLQSRHRLVRLGVTFTMGLVVISVVGSYSRGALLGLGAVSFAIWLRSHNKAITAVIVVAGLAGAVNFMPAAWFARMHTIQSYKQDDSAETRLSMWKEATKIALARPATGGGFAVTYVRSVVQQFVPDGEARAVHSIWFECLGENGFPTFFIWLSMIIVGVINTRWLMRRTRGIPDLKWANDLARSVQASIIAYVVAGSFLSLSYWDYFFMILVALAATREIVAQAVPVLRTRQGVEVTGRLAQARLGPSRGALHGQART